MLREAQVSELKHFLFASLDNVCSILDLVRLEEQMVVGDYDLHVLCIYKPDLLEVERAKLLVKARHNVLESDDVPVLLRLIFH